MRTSPQPAGAQCANIPTINDAHRVQGAEEATDLSHAHAGVEVGDPKPATAREGLQGRMRHIASTPAARA